MGAGGRANMEAGGAAPASSDPIQLMQKLAQEPRYAPFFDDAFDIARFVSTSLSDSAMASRSAPGSSLTMAQHQIESIQEGVTLLDGVVRAEVTRRQAELLQQASQLRDAESYLTSVNTSTDNLHTTLNRVRGDIVEPYTAISGRTQQLQNLLTTTNLLRHATHAYKLLTKLRTQLGDDGLPSTTGAGMLDLAKSAKLISDIQAVLQQAELGGLAVIESELPMLESARARVRTEATKVLCSGMEGMNQAEVGSALQVLFNLQELQQTVQAVLQRLVERVDEAFTTALDAQRVAAASGQSATRLQEVLWQGVGQALQTLQSSVIEACLLQRVLAKKRDPLTHVLFLEEVTVGGGPGPLAFLWSKLVRIVRSSLEGVASGAAGGNSVRELLVVQFPRLAVALEDCVSAIQRDTEVKGSTAPALDATQRTQLLDAAMALQRAYVATCLQRMTDSAAAAFPGGARALPPAAELQKCIARMHDEVKAVSSSQRLSVLVAQQIGTALGMLASKAQYMAATGPDARALGSGTTAAQQRNIALANALQEVHRSMLQLQQKLPAQAHAHMRQPLEAVRSAAVEVLMPLFRALVDAAEAQLLKMHAEDYNAPPRAGMIGKPGPSATMQGLVRMLAQWRSEYITRFTPLPSPSANSVAAALVERMAARIVYFFVRHAALKRPLAPEGVQLLGRDAQELEASINQYVYPCEHIGAPFRMLRALRPFLSAPVESLPNSPLLHELPASVVLHHLYARAPEALQSPHARSGLTAGQYSVWLDQHSMAEVVAGIRKALEGDADKLAEGDVEGRATLAVMLQLAK